MQFCHPNSDAISRTLDASRPIFCASYMCSWKCSSVDMVFDESVNALALASRNPPYIRDRRGPLPTPILLSAHFDQSYYSRHAAQKFAHLHTTQRSVTSCAWVFGELVPGIAFSNGAVWPPFLRLAPRPHRKIRGSACRNHLPLRLQLERPALPRQRRLAHIGRRGHLNPLKSSVTAYKERSLRRF